MTEVKKNKAVTKYPSAFSVVAREFKKTDLLTSLIIFNYNVIQYDFNIYIRLTDLYASYHEVNILDDFLVPGEDGFLLVTDAGGHSVFGWLMMGIGNSMLISFLVTALTVGIGTLVGLTISYMGRVDNIVMRIIDFLVILPYLMIIIVFVSVRGYGVLVLY